MKELDIDVSNNYPTDVAVYLNESFDYVITVCDGAKEVCPVFAGDVKHRLHIGFEDPAEVEGAPEYVLSEYRRIREEIKRDFKYFYNEHIKS